MTVIKYPVLFSVLFFSFASHAEFISSKKSEGEITIKAALELADKSKVIVNGKIIKEIRSEKFLLSDGTAEVCVEIDKKNMPTEKFDETVNLKITGEIDKDFKLNGDQCDKFKIDAKSVEIVKNK